VSEKAIKFAISYRVFQGSHGSAASAEGGLRAISQNGHVVSIKKGAFGNCPSYLSAIRFREARCFHSMWFGNERGSRFGPTIFSVPPTHKRSYKLYQGTRLRIRRLCVRITPGAWQRELKDRALWRVCCRPQTSMVSFDNRTANRQAHAHSLRFSCIEGLENTLQFR
jgi:hypothetical protein